MSNHLQENESFGEKSEVFYHLLLYAYLSCGHVMCILYKTLSKNIFMPPIFLCMGGELFTSDQLIKYILSHPMQNV